MTLTDYEAKITAILTAPLPEQVVTDEMGDTTPAAEYRAFQLSHLSQEIRRIVWSPEVKARAWVIARRADEVAAELTGSITVQPLPRFDALLSNGIIHPAIQ